MNSLKDSILELRILVKELKDKYNEDRGEPYYYTSDSYERIDRLEYLLKILEGSK